MSIIQKELKDQTEEISRQTNCSRQYQTQLLDVTKEKAELEKIVEEQKKKIHKQENEVGSCSGD